MWLLEEVLWLLWGEEYESRAQSLSPPRYGGGDRSGGGRGGDRRGDYDRPRTPDRYRDDWDRRGDYDRPRTTVDLLLDEEDIMMMMAGEVMTIVVVVEVEDEVEDVE